MVDELLELVGGLGQDHASADVQHRILCIQEVLDDPLRGLRVEARLGQHRVVGEHPVEEVDLDLLGEDVHRHVDEHRAGPARLREHERLLEDLREQVRGVDPPHALAERAVDLALRGVGVEVDLLVRVLAVVVGRHVAGDDDHRDRVERGVGDPGGGVGQARAQVREHDGGPAGGPGVPVGHVGGELLVAGVDELDRALLHGGEHRDVRVAAQTEDVRHAPLFEVAHELVADEVLHVLAPWLRFAETLGRP